MDSAQLFAKDGQSASSHWRPLGIEPVRDTLGIRICTYRDALVDSSKEEWLRHFAKFSRECKLAQEDMVGRGEATQKPRVSQSIAAEQRESRIAILHVSEHTQQTDMRRSAWRRCELVFDQSDYFARCVDQQSLRINQDDGRRRALKHLEGSLKEGRGQHIVGGGPLEIAGATLSEDPIEVPRGTAIVVVANEFDAAILVRIVLNDLRGSISRTVVRYDELESAVCLSKDGVESIREKALSVENRKSDRD